MRTKLAIFTFFMIVLTGCAVKEHLQSQTKLAVEAGVSRGGITDNTDMSVFTATDGGVVTPDAYTGATHTGFHTALNINIPLRRNELETGLGYMYNAQTFNYNDPGIGYLGKRHVNLSQFQIPLTYNFLLFRRVLPSNEVQLRIGYLGQLNFMGIQDEGQVPVFEQKHWSNGALLGFSAYLYEFSNGNRVGVYAGVYRGSQVYYDYYNQEQFEMPGTSFIKAGVRYRFR